jgi:hypothetical protein
MRIQIRAFAGIDYAEFDVSPLALLVGHNHQGKTSICEAVAAALANTAAVRHVSKKKDLPTLVNERHKDGWINITGDDGKSACRLTWPSGDYTSVGSEVPRSTRLAVGLDHVLVVKPEERASFLIEALDAKATREDLEIALRPIIPSDATRKRFLDEKLWKMIDEHGWDVAYKHADENRLKFDNGWWRITGERYGHTKAETWRPDPWWPELEAPDVTHATLTAARDQLRAEVEAAVNTKAATTGEKIQLVKIADTLPEAERALTTAQRQEQDARSALQAARAQRAACLEIPQDQPSWHKCPHCKEAIVIRDGKLFAPSQAALMPAQIQERADAITVADNAVASADLQLEKAQRALAECEVAVQAAEKAKERLDESFEAERAAPADDLAMEKRQALAVAEQQLIQFQRFEEAKKMHAASRQGTRIAAELAPDGLRMRVLTAKLEAFNKQLGALCAQIDHAPLWLAANMTVMVGSREYAALSKSEQFVAQIAFRLAVSMLTSDRNPVACVVIDEADILDPPSRGKLIKMLLASKLPAIVAMTVGKPTDVPDLSRGKGTGATYWVANGTIAPIAERLAQAAA